MAKITDLNVATALTGDEHLPIVQGSTTKRVTMNAFRALITPFLQNWYRGDPGPAGPSNNTRTTIAALKAASPSDLTSLYDGSLWAWVPGDHSARAADPDVIAGDGIALTTGAWRRRSADLLNDSTRTYAPRGDEHAVAINALLALPDVRTVILPAGVLPIGQSVIVPAGKTLKLQPDTILRALPDFAMVNKLNGGVVLAGSRAAIEGGTIDMNKRGLGMGSANRYNGCMVLNGARDCLRTDLVVMNCTGYAVYDSGNDDMQSMPSSSNTRVRTFNSQIHFEPQGADGTVYTDCHAADGDGDIPCLSWYHPLVGSRNIRFVRCTAYGIAAAGVDMTGNIARLRNIELIDCDIEMAPQAATVALAAAPGWLGVDGLVVRGGRYKTTYIAAALSGCIGTMTGVRLEGGNALEATDSVIDCEGCHAVAGSDPQGTTIGRGVLTYGSGRVRWNGGSIIVTGPPETTATIGNVRVGADTRLIPALPAGFVARNEQLGTATFEVDGAHSYVNLFPVYTNLAKVHLSLSIRRLTDGYGPGRAAPEMTWVEIENGFIRVRVTGVAYGNDYRLHWHLIEAA